MELCWGRLRLVTSFMRGTRITHVYEESGRAVTLSVIQRCNGRSTFDSQKQSYSD